MRGYIQGGSGIGTVYHEYGDLLAIQSRFANPHIAAKMALHVRPRDILV